MRAPTDTRASTAAPDPAPLQAAGTAAPTRRPGRLLAAALLTVALAACGSEGPQSGPGVRSVTIVSPEGPEGAALVELRGPGIEDVSPLDGRVFHHARGDTVRVVVVREEGGELRFAVRLADTLAVPSGVVLEVADPGNRLRGALGGYRVEVAR